MNTSIERSGIIRELWPSEANRFRNHLLRLTQTGLRMRFAHCVSEEFVADYAVRMIEKCSIVVAYVEHNEVRGTAELRQLLD